MTIKLKGSKMKKIILITVCLISSSTVFSQVTQQWVKNYNDVFNGNDLAEFMALDGSGNVYITGNAEGWYGHYEIVTIKYGPSGAQQWLAEYTNAYTGYETTYGITVDNSENVYVLGMHWISNGNTSIVTIKYNSSGVLQWAKQFTSAFGGAADPSAIAVDGTGNVYVTGACIGNTFTTDYITIKYSANGVQQWAKMYNGSSNGSDAATAMALDNSGNIIITGWANSTNFGTGEYLTIKYSPSGNQQWLVTYQGPTSGSDIPASIAVDGSGNCYVTGESKGTDSYYHCATVKYNTNGIEQWAQRYNGGGNGDDKLSKIVIKDGYIYASGSLQGVGTGQDYLVIKYTPSGNQVWASTYNGPIGGGADFTSGVAVDDYGDVYVTGSSAGSGGIKQIATVRFNPNGTRQWVQRFNSGQCMGYVDQGGKDIAIGPSSGLYVTGYSTQNDQNCSYCDFCTIKYSQTGLGITPLSGNIPDKYSLEQNYPNPFNPSTNINFSIPKGGNVKLVIYDINGREVATVINENLAAGTYRADYDAAGLSSGAYFYRIITDEFTETKKMMVVK